MSEFAQVFLVGKPVDVPEKPGLQRWTMIVEHKYKTDRLKLEWISTYNPKLASLGMKEVEFYKDTSDRLCIRVPRRGQPWQKY